MRESDKSNDKQPTHDSPVDDNRASQILSERQNRKNQSILQILLSDFLQNNKVLEKDHSGSEDNQNEE